MRLEADDRHLSLTLLLELGEQLVLIALFFLEVFITHAFNDAVGPSRIGLVEFKGLHVFSLEFDVGYVLVDP